MLRYTSWVLGGRVASKQGVGAGRPPEYSFIKLKKASLAKGSNFLHGVISGSDVLIM